MVVGAGPTGVELAGEIVQLAERTLAGAFRTITPSECRVILLDAAPAVLPPMGPKLGLKAQRRLEKMDVEVQLNAMVTAVDYMGITVKEKDGGERRIECACKVWAAGVQASPLGKMIAEQSDGTETDRAGRVIVEPDLTVKGHPNVFVVGDLMSVPGVPGMAQGAIQGAHYATTLIKHAVKGHDDPANRKPFKYFDKGSMARSPGTAPSRRSASWSSAASSPGWRGWCCTCTTWSATATASPPCSPGGSRSWAAPAARWPSPAR